jgi:hypothetical protein
MCPIPEEETTEFGHDSRFTRFSRFIVNIPFTIFEEYHIFRENTTEVTLMAHTAMEEFCML